MGASDERVLSYGDVLLRQSDVSLLDGPHYLNDQIIEFFFNYLSKEHCSSSGVQENEVSPLLLVGPTLTFWLLHCPDSESLMAAIDPMKFEGREMVMFALNNNEDVETAEGGTHWTLLMFNRLIPFSRAATSFKLLFADHPLCKDIDLVVVFALFPQVTPHVDRQRNTFEHFDSMAGTNLKQARELMNIIKPYMGAGVPGARFIEQATPQQENNYDCGVYVMAFAKVLCHAFQEKKKSGQSRSRSGEYAGLVRSSVSPSSVNTMRYTTLELIDTLSASSNTRGCKHKADLQLREWLLGEKPQGQHAKDDLGTLADLTDTLWNGSEHLLS